MRATENSASARSAAGRAEALARAPGSSSSSRSAPATASTSPAATSTAGLAVRDDLRHGADARRHDRQRREHRLEQHDPEPLPARGVDEDVGALEPVADVGAAGKDDRVVEPELAGRAPASRPRAARRRGSRAARPAARRARARRRAAASGGPSARSAARPRARAARPAGIPSCSGVTSRARGGQLVEAVVDRDELLRRVTRRLEEAADGVRDRDQPCARRARRRGRRSGTARAGSGRRCAGSDEVRQPQRAGGDRAVDVGVHEVRVDEVGPLGADARGRRRGPCAG